MGDRVISKQRPMNLDVVKKIYEILPQIGRARPQKLASYDLKK
jgi:hypothetical protein